MEHDALKNLWRETLAAPTEAKMDGAAYSVVELYLSDPGLREHIKNRSKQVIETTGASFDADKFDIAMARAFIADEIGYKSWGELVAAVNDGEIRARAIIFDFAKAAMSRGDFTSLEQTLGEDAFDETIIDWYGRGYFDGEAETLNEIFAASCMLGYPKTAAFLLDEGVDSYAGMKTGLSGFHYAASSGRLDVIKLLIERGVPMEVKNMYGGTVFEQAIWSAVNEHTPQHGEIIERLVEAGAVVDDGYQEWWAKQDVPDQATKERIARVLEQHAEFHKKITDAKQNVLNAESQSDKQILADSLKVLGNILRRPSFLRDQATAAYERAANLYKEVGLPLEAAWVLRHIGINHEYAERLDEAEKYYDESLALFRQHAGDDDLNYANTVRYPAAIKNRIGKRDESARLWEEAVRRYAQIAQPFGIAEGAAWLSIFAIEKGELRRADEWLARAQEASKSSGDAAIHRFVDDVRSQLEDAKRAADH